jgi:hypothetical protein
MKETLPRIFTPNAKIVKQTDDATTFRVVGIPYGGPDYLGGVDLQGERFDKSATDYGKNENGEVVVDTIYAFYDHALNDRVGKKLLGYAKFYQDTDDGQLWDIEVRRAYRYHDMLAALAEKNLLGASSQPVQTAVEIDGATGLIKQWMPAEISLTTTPANPKAVAEVMKNFKLEDEDLGENQENTEEELPSLEELIGADNSGDIDELFNEGEADQEELVSEGLSGEIKAVLDLVKALKAEVATLTALVTDNQAKSVEEHRVLATGIANVNNGLKSFSTHVAAKLKIEAQVIADDLARQTEEERDAEEDARNIRRTKSGVPAHAPGKRS